MDDSASASDGLDALANLLTELSVNSFDIDLHVQHINLARSLDMDEQVFVAREMATSYLAVGDDVWLPLVDVKVSSTNLENPASVLEVLELYARAEADYLSIPILQKHIEFLIDRHAYFAALEVPPEELGDCFSTAWTREAISEVVSKGTGHLTKSRYLWELQRDWELEMIEAASPTDRPELIQHVEELHLARLQQPHAGHEDTYQSYSSFTTTYKPATEYESLLVAASKLRSRAVKVYERRERSELSLTSLEAYMHYLAAERKGKTPDGFIVRGLYERSIAEVAKRRFAGEGSAEQTLRTLWLGYVDFMRGQGIDEGDLTHIIQRATRSVPGSGEVWARYIRHLERIAEPASEDAPMDGSESISDAYQRALSTNLFTKINPKGPDLDPEQIIPLVLARAGAEKRAIEAGKGDEDAFSTLIKVIEDGLVMVRQASKVGDQRFRLEKFLSELYLSLADVADAAIALWASAAAHYKFSWAVWVAYTDVLIRTDRHDAARSAFQDVSTKNLDYPEALWDAWLSFEHAHGSLASLEDALVRVERARTQVEARRMRVAQKAYEAAQYSMEQQAASAVLTSLPTNVTQEQTPAASGDGMDVDVPITSAKPQGKRKASEEPEVDGSASKKVRMEPLNAPLKRDRENCTVFVADLPAGTSEEQLKALFKDCGEIREVKITNMPETLVATVEFAARENIPAALTKDKKRIEGMEVNVHLAWRSTLYVTNFPEKTDDAAIRDLFGQYGLILDVRWPSKKFKATRRFCYVQFTSPASAEKALELHGRELEPERTLSVYISNPERKRERTDADANEREVYVAGLSKFTNKKDLQGVFSRYGAIKDIRLAEDKNGQIKGFGFVEFENEADARAALSANNYELKKRRIAVTLADTRVGSKNREGWAESGLGRRTETLNRSVRIRNLPSDTQEGLLQQALEKYATVNRTEFFADSGEAIVELANTAEAGKLLLRPEPIVFNGINLEIHEEALSSSTRAQPATAPTSAGGLFVPRTAASRPRAGLGRARKPGIGASKPRGGAANNTQGAAKLGGKGQDDFRKMLG
ncbi:hypothetical protein J3R82DRAFT_9471 [Butyriboletus roseoflavus]|nr:hypothetical protein J3R82DRAFT_9471 [Butyriboletus roseoflavus]